MTPARPQPVVPTAADERLDRLEHKLDLILRLLDAKGRGVGMTARDWRLLDAIADHVGYEVVFSTTDLKRHADVVESGLRAAFADSRLKDATALGRRLDRISRHYFGLVNLGRDEDGVMWCLTPPDAVTSERQASR